MPPPKAPEACAHDVLLASVVLSMYVHLHMYAHVCTLKIVTNIVTCLALQLGSKASGQRSGVDDGDETQVGS